MEVIVDTSKGVYKERIVRCKECVHCSAYDDELFCGIHTDDVTADDFCSYGEREGE